jgi:hypothetical protein
MSTSKRPNLSPDATTPLHRMTGMQPWLRLRSSGRRLSPGTKATGGPHVSGRVTSNIREIKASRESSDMKRRLSGGPPSIGDAVTQDDIERAETKVNRTTRRWASVAIAAAAFTLLVGSLAAGIIVDQAQTRSHSIEIFQLRGQAYAGFVSTYLAQQADREIDVAQRSLTSQVSPRVRQRHRCFWKQCRGSSRRIGSSSGPGTQRSRQTWSGYR